MSSCVNHDGFIAVREDATHGVEHETQNSTHRCVSQRLPKLFLDFISDGTSDKVLASRVQRSEALLRASSRDECLILGQMAGGSVVLGV